MSTEKWSRANNEGERFLSNSHDFIEGGALFWANDEQCALCGEIAAWHDEVVPPTPEENEAAKQRLREKLPGYIQQVVAAQERIHAVMGQNDKWQMLEEIREGFERMNTELQADAH